MRTRLWEMWLEDLSLSTRAFLCLHYQRDLSYAWHAAVLCDRCLLRTRTLGTHRLAEIRAALEVRGFPRAPACCAWLKVGGVTTYESACEQDLVASREMLERGDWSWQPA